MRNIDISTQQWATIFAQYALSQSGNLVEMPLDTIIKVININGTIQQYRFSEFSADPIKIIKRQAGAVNSGEQRFEIIFLNKPIATGFEGDIFTSNYVAKVNASGDIYEVKPSNKLIKLVRKGDTFDFKSLKKENAFFREMHDNKSHLSKFENNDSSEYKAALSMKAFSGSSLKHKLRYGNLDVRSCLILACNLAKAIREMHQKGIIHHDLNLENFIVDYELNVKIIDFGLSEKTGAPSGDKAKLWILAPERLLEKGIKSEPKQDYFSYAGILAYIFKGLNATKRAVSLKNKKASPSAVQNNFYNLHGLFKGLKKTDKLEIMIRSAIYNLGSLDPNRRSESLDDFIEQVENYIQNDLPEEAPMPILSFGTENMQCISDPEYQTYDCTDSYSIAEIAPQHSWMNNCDSFEAGFDDDDSYALENLGIHKFA